MQIQIRLLNHHDILLFKNILLMIKMVQIFGFLLLGTMCVNYWMLTVLFRFDLFFSYLHAFLELSKFNFLFGFWLRFGDCCSTQEVFYVEVLRFFKTSRWIILHIQHFPQSSSKTGIKDRLSVRLLGLHAVVLYMHRILKTTLRGIQNYKKNGLSITTLNTRKL